MHDNDLDSPHMKIRKIISELQNFNINTCTHVSQLEYLLRDIRKFFTPKSASEARDCNNAAVHLGGKSKSAGTCIDDRELTENINTSKDGNTNSSWYKGCNVDVS